MFKLYTIIFKLNCNTLVNTVHEVITFNKHFDLTSENK